MQLESKEIRLGLRIGSLLVMVCIWALEVFSQYYAEMCNITVMHKQSGTHKLHMHADLHK